MIPAIYDNGTHYVANHRLTSEMLDQICEDDVLEVNGEYDGDIGGWVLLMNMQNIYAIDMRPIIILYYHRLRLLASLPQMVSMRI